MSANIDDRKHNVKQIVEENGFTFEEHQVTTEDGYILTLHRIPGKKGAPAVILQHGIEDCSIQWVINSPELAPAFTLSKAGFDVWMGNNRGTMYSDKHVKYTTKDKEYWDFDFEEMGLYDQPAYMDYILNNTGLEKISAYIGHSEGTSQMFIGASLKPDYFKSKVDLFVALAPIVRLDHNKNGAMTMASQINGILSDAIQEFHMYDLLPRGPESPLMGDFCAHLPHFCEKLDDGFFDFDGKIDNAERWGDRESHSPNGSGWRNLIHYAQIIKDKKFQRFDFGKEENMKKYGTETPPEYDLSKISIKMAIMQGDLDMLSDTTDDAWLLDEKQSGLKTDLVVYHEMLHFGHVSFMMAKDMSYVDRLVKVIHENSLTKVKALE